MTNEDPYRDDPDVALMLSFQKGDDRAFDVLFAKYTRPLVNFANRLLANRERAEEIAQEVFLEVHRARKTYAPRARFSTWIYRMSTNRCLNELRRPERRIMVSKPNDADAEDRNDPEPVEDGPDPLATLQGRRLLESIQVAMGDLPEQQRTAIILCRYHALSYREIAEVMETTESAVRSLIHRATVSLRDRLKSYL